MAFHTDAPLDPQASLVATTNRLEPFAEGAYLAVGPGPAGESSILGNDERVLLQALGRPATRPELEQRIAQFGLETGDPEHLDSMVKRLLAARLLVPVADALRGLNQPPAPSPQGPISVSWITSGRRPDLLRRSTESVRRVGIDGHGNQDGISNYIVFDDSPKGAARKSPAGLDSVTHYVGTEEARQLASAIKSALAEEDMQAVDLALGMATKYPILTTGANRNRWLLLIAGQTAVSFDDDVKLPYVCDPSIGPGAPGDTALLSSRHDPSRQLFFQDQRELEDKLQSLDSGLSSFVGTLDALGESRIDWSDMGPDAAAAGLAGSLRVVATSAGIIGDSGMKRGHLPLFLTEPDRSRLWEQNPHNAVRFLGNRLLSRHVQATTLSTGSHFMAPHFAVDASVLLPPFPPFYRNEDGVFRVALSVLDRGAMVAHLPFGVYHQPKTNLAPLPDPSAPVYPHLADFLLAALMEYQTLCSSNDSGTSNYTSLAYYLTSLASLSNGGFHEWICWTWGRIISQRVRQGEELLHVYNSKPDVWAEVMEGHLEALENSIENIVPEDFDGAVPEDPISSVAEYIGDYGRILAAWPAIWSAAAGLNPTDFATTL